MRHTAKVAALAMTMAAAGCGNGKGTSAPSGPATPGAVAKATAAQVALPATTETLGSSNSAPDHQMDIDAYTSIIDEQTLASLALAFSTLPLTDDQKLTLLPGAQAVGDAFAKRDLLVKSLPRLDAQLDAVRAQRYYRVDLVPPSAHADPKAKSISWNGWTPLLDAYDFDKKGFPISCLSGTTLLTNRTPAQNYFETVEFRPTKGVFPPTTAHGAMCLLPVPNEETAKTIEAVRTRAGGRLRVGTATLYFYVIDAIPGGWPSTIHAVLTHADLTLLNPTDSATPLARVSFDP